MPKGRAPCRDKQAVENRIKFAAAYAVSGVQAEAARQAGISSESAKNYSKEPWVKEVLEKAKARAIETVKLTVEKALDEAQEAIEFAKKTDNANAYVKAVELRAKISGLLEDKKNPMALGGGFVVQIVGVRGHGAPVAVLEEPPIEVEALPAPQTVDSEEDDPWAD